MACALHSLYSIEMQGIVIDIDIELAISICKPILDFDAKDNGFEDALVEANEDGAKSLLAAIEYSKTVEQMDVCRNACLQESQPAVKEARDIVQNVFAGKMQLEFSGDALEKYMQLGFKSDVSRAIGILRTLPGNDIVLAELSFIDKFCGMAQKVAVIQKEIIASKDRKAALPTEENVVRIVSARNAIQDVESFVEEFNQTSKTNLFAKKSQGNVKDLLTSGKDKVVGINADWDNSLMPLAFSGSRKVVSAVISRWSSDASELCNLIKGYMKDFDVEKCKQDIFSEQHSAVLALLKSEEGQQQCTKLGKGSSMLASWRKCLLKVNNDGNGTVFGQTLLQSMQDVVANGIQIHDIGQAVDRICTQLPKIRNKPKRSEQAKSYLSSAPKTLTFPGRKMLPWMILPHGLRGSIGISEATGDGG